MRRLRTVNPVLPAVISSDHGIAYSLWLPRDPARAIGAVVILHGAGSCKESHHDFARAGLPLGLAAIAFDQRGHGESPGRLDDRVLDDVARMAAIVRAALGDAEAPVALRGSSMGGYLAILAAEPARARVVVAICPASGEGLQRGLRDGFTRGTPGFEFDAPALDGFLAAHNLHDTVAALDRPLLLMHAEGDEQVPVEHSRELAQLARHPDSRLIAVPGGHHRSVQHDPELQAVSLRFIVRALSA